MEQSQRIAVVTGASRGIGHSVAVRLAADGFRVFGLSRSTTNDPAFTHVTCDVRSTDSIETAISDVEDQTGEPISILVNNAGVTRDGLVMTMSDEAWIEVLETDLHSAFYLTRRVLRGMFRQRYGRVVNVGSVAGMLGNAGQANYSSAKAGLMGLTKSVAREVASRGITVNLVAPGLVDTDMMSDLSDRARDRALAAVPIGRMGQPEEIAHAVSFAASYESSYMTGAVIPVDGGLS